MMYLVVVKCVSLIFIILCGLAVAANAQTKTLERKVIDANISISEMIDSWAERLDLFFAGQKLIDRKNETTVIFSYYGHKTEYQDFEDEFRADISLRLPNTEEHWSLKFTTQDDPEYESLDRHRPGAPPRPTRYGVSLGLLKKLGEFDVTFRPGIKIKDPIETSHILSLRNSVNHGRWHLNPRLDFFADSAKGVGQSIAFGFHYNLNDSWIFTWVNEEKYMDLNNFFSTLHGPGLLYIQSDKVSYMGSLHAYSTNENNAFHLQSWLLAFSRRHEIWRRILYYNISPSWTFDKNNNFKHVFDIAVQIDLIF